MANTYSILTVVADVRKGGRHDAKCRQKRKGREEDQFLPMICDGLYVLALSKRSTVAKILNASLKREAYNIIEIKKEVFSPEVLRAF